MTLTNAQRQNIQRTIDAFCDKTGTAREHITPDQAQHIARTMGVHVYPNVVEAIESVLSGEG